MKTLRLTFLALLVTALACAGRDGGAKPILSILGDSYSTFQGFNPDGYATWYRPQAAADNRTDVTSVRQTWWWQVVDRGGYILGVNESYSGSTISYTGYRGEDYADRSFITRLPRVGAADVLLIFGGTNDDWTGSPLGQYTVPGQALSRGHLYELRPALARLLTLAQDRYPGTRLLFIINCDLRPEVTESIVTVCRALGVEYVLLHDVAKQEGHPTVAGMEAIRDQVLQALGQ